MRKDAAEIAELRAAGAAIDRVHARMAEFLKPGRTEEQVGADIAAAIVEEGHTEAAFVIVGSGPNGASPHHGVSARVIESGELVVIDIGGPLPSGYFSDSTRTYAVGTEPAGRGPRGLPGAAGRAGAAVAAVRPGVRAEQVDAAARELITEAGMGERFVHRTGHGIGLEVHEEPYIVGGNAAGAGAGDGVQRRAGHLLRRRVGRPDRGHRGGHRADGCERLNTRPRDLVVL